MFLGGLFTINSFGSATKKLAHLRKCKVNIFDCKKLFFSKENYNIYESFKSMIKVYFQISMITFWTFIIFMDYRAETIIDFLILAGLILMSWYCFVSVKNIF